MFKRRLFATVLCIVLICTVCCLWGCEEKEEDLSVYKINMNTDFPQGELPDLQGHVKVVLLLGQSNASGCSLTEYLATRVSADKYNEYETGYDNVLINYCIDDHAYTSNGNFVSVDLSCACGEGRFGPEVGMAEILSQFYADETVVILKYTMSGYSLNYHWLCKGQRGDIYNACLAFVKTYMKSLSKICTPQIGAICWMQGESDTTEAKAAKYFDNQQAFVGFLRQDLSDYACDGGIYFVDAGISSSPYCLPSYPEINAAKVRFAVTDEKMNRYFSTIDMGLTTLNEPTVESDLGHYDSLEEIRLGRRFGQEVVATYVDRDKS